MKNEKKKNILSWFPWKEHDIRKPICKRQKFKCCQVCSQEEKKAVLQIFLHLNRSQVGYLWCNLSNNELLLWHQPSRFSTQAEIFDWERLWVSLQYRYVFPLRYIFITADWIPSASALQRDCWCLIDNYYLNFKLDNWNQICSCLILHFCK